MPRSGGGGGAIDKKKDPHGRGAHRRGEEALRRELEYALEWSGRDRELLERHQGLLSRRTSAFAERLYEYLFSNPSIAERLYRIRDEGGEMGEFVRHLLHLLLTLSSPTLDDGLLARYARRLAERGFEPAWLLGVYRLYFDFLLEEIDRAEALEAGTRRALRSALAKHLCFDLGQLIERLARYGARREAQRPSSPGGPLVHDPDRLRRAIAGGEFVLHYQPQVTTFGGEPAGFEALVRWRHPERGLLLPAQFLPDVADSGLMAELSRWVLGTALAQAARWHRRWGRPLPVAVNLPAEMLDDPDFLDWLAETLARQGADDGLLELELAASRLEWLEDAAGVPQRLAGMGVRIAVEDFGTARHSLSGLERLPVTRVKLDRVLLDVQGAEGRSLARALVTLGHEMGYRVLAEGVETERERRLAVAAGCDALQGFRVGTPAPAERIEEWLGGLS